MMNSQNSENRLAAIVVPLIGYSVLGSFMLGIAALLHETLKQCFGWTHTLPYTLIISVICFTYLAMDRKLCRSAKFSATLPISIAIVMGAVVLKALFSLGSGNSEEGFSSIYRSFDIPFWASIFICYVFFNFNENDRRNVIESYQKRV